jgi:hypothetical protein
VRLTGDNPEQRQLFEPEIAPCALGWPPSVFLPATGELERTKAPPHVRGWHTVLAGIGAADFAPGYIIHDWLFEQHHCKKGDWEQYDFKRSADVWAVYQAVSGDIARNFWETGKCKPLHGPATSLAVPGKKLVPIKKIPF